MADNLLIVESPAKMRTIGKYLGKSFKVDASMGHAIDLPVRELGIDVEKNFEPKYVTMKGKGKILQKLRQEAGKVSTVYLATDPDREGEAIAWHIAGALKNKKCEIKRITFNEISKKAVTEAIEHPSEINMDLVNAQQARRILDRLVGYKVSPFLWKTIYRGLSAGRVQTVALRMICEREQEIRKFKPDEYWTLDAELAKKSGEQFSCSLQKIDGKKAELKTGNETQSVIDRVKPGPFTVVSVSKKKKKRNPSPPFITSTMQQEAARKLHFSASKTMFLAQQLYEGLEINGESTGLITYMRTDSFRIADAASEQAENFIASEFGKEYLPEKRPYYKKSGKTQDAHEAVRPVNPVKEFSPETVKKSLSRDQFRLYELIWKRFMASRMAPAEYDATSCDIESGGCLFRATGLITRFKGFTILYTESSDNGKSGSEESFLPELLENENLELVKLIDKQHFTQPPPRYSEASLV
ncbi:MAG: type I DNA topoisomerase, partial [Fibrobacterota bacterium]